MNSKTKLTTEAGIPVGDNQNSLTAGPLWLQDRPFFPRVDDPWKRIGN
jgi:catalase